AEDAALRGGADPCGAGLAGAGFERGGTACFRRQRYLWPAVTEPAGAAVGGPDAPRLGFGVVLAQLDRSVLPGSAPPRRRGPATGSVARDRGVPRPCQHDSRGVGRAWSGPGASPPLLYAGPGGVGAV